MMIYTKKDKLFRKHELIFWDEYIAIENLTDSYTDLH